jgi:CheY-like chemotaxis protein
VEAPAPEALKKPLSILLVDDDVLIRETFPSLLERMGHRVETVASGHEALQRLSKAPPFDLILLDKNMPGMDGLETLTRLRQLHPVLPVILATGDLQSSDEDALLKAGRARSLHKPFTGKELAKALGHLNP